MISTTSRNQDEPKQIVILGSGFAGIDPRTSVNCKKVRIKKERQKELAAIQDKDIKRKIQKGNHITIHQHQ